MNVSAYESPIHPDSKEDVSHSITSNIRQLMEGEIDISPKDNAHLSQRANLPSHFVESDTNAGSKGGINLIGMDIDKDLMRTKKRGRNDN